MHTTPHLTHQELFVSEGKNMLFYYRQWFTHVPLVSTLVVTRA